MIGTAALLGDFPANLFGVGIFQYAKTKIAAAAGDKRCCAHDCAELPRDESEQTNNRSLRLRGIVRESHVTCLPSINGALTTAPYQLSGSS